MTTLILGAGIIGTTTAYYLAKQGEQVTVIDRQPSAGLETSFANGGLVTPSMSDPWGAPGLPLKLIKWLGKDDAPFLLRLKSIPGLLSWGSKFLRNCSEENWRANAKVVYRLAQYSCDSLDNLVNELDINHDRVDRGNIRVFRDDASMEAAIKGTALMNEFGVASKQVDADGCVALEPCLAPVADQLMGGISFPDDRSGDAYQFTKQLAEQCAALGVTFHFDTTIDHIEKGGNRIVAVHTKDNKKFTANNYVMALGSYSPLTARSLGIKLPIAPVKGYSLTLTADGMDKPPSIPVVDDSNKLAVTPLGNRLRAAGTAEVTGYDLTPNRKRADMLLRSVRALYPQLRIDGDVDIWCGLRPVTPDGPPILGATPLPNLYINAGQGHLGWTMACGSARVVSDTILGKTPDIDMQGLTLNRYT